VNDFCLNRNSTFALNPTFAQVKDFLSSENKIIALDPIFIQAN